MRNIIWLVTLIIVTQAASKWNHTGQVAKLCEPFEKVTQCALKISYVCSTLQNGATFPFYNLCAGCKFHNVISIQKGFCLSLTSGSNGSRFSINQSSPSFTVQQIQELVLASKSTRQLNNLINFNSQTTGNKSSQNQGNRTQIGTLNNSKQIKNIQTSQKSKNSTQAPKTQIPIKTNKTSISTKGGNSRVQRNKTQNNVPKASKIQSSKLNRTQIKNNNLNSTIQVQLNRSAQTNGNKDPPYPLYSNFLNPIVAQFCSRCQSIPDLVCAFLQNSTTITFSKACSACNYYGVVSISYGRCKQKNTVQINSPPVTNLSFSPTNSQILDQNPFRVWTANEFFEYVKTQPFGVSKTEASANGYYETYENSNHLLLYLQNEILCQSYASYPCQSNYQIGCAFTNNQTFQDTINICGACKKQNVVSVAKVLCPPRGTYIRSTNPPIGSTLGSNSAQNRNQYVRNTTDNIQKPTLSTLNPNPSFTKPISNTVPTSNYTQPAITQRPTSRQSTYKSPFRQQASFSCMNRDPCSRSLLSRISVCAIRKDGSRRNEMNSCDACKDRTVERFYYGLCRLT